MAQKAIRRYTDEEIHPTWLALREYNRSRRAETSTKDERIAELEAELADYEAIIVQIEAEQTAYADKLSDAIGLLRKVITPLRRTITFEGNTIREEIQEASKFLDDDLPTRLRNYINPFSKEDGAK